MENKDRYVRPGEEIGTEEEFVAGAGTFMEADRIYAAISGKLVEKDRTLSVLGSPGVTLIEKGAMVIGRIENISEPVALAVVEVEESEHSRFPKSSAYVVLHASYIKRGYVKNVRDEYRIGDVIRAKVVEQKHGEYHISTDEPHCGCLLAFCSACRAPLEMRQTVMQCTSCQRRENRKVADDYQLCAKTQSSE